MRTVATHPQVWVSVDYRPSDPRPNEFLLARRVREGLRQAGLPANLFSIRESLESVLGRQPLEVVFPLETGYPRRGFHRDPFGLLRALESRRVSFVGSSYEVSSRAYDKELSKRLLSLAGIHVPDGICLRDKSLGEQAAAPFLKKFSCPAVVKPVTGPGGSHGVEFIPHEAALLRSVEEWATSNSGPILIEEFIKGPEVSAWIFGIEPDVRCHSILSVEKDGRPIYDRDAKRGRPLLRVSQDEEYRRALSRPRRLSESERMRAAETALKAHRALGVYAYSRVDMVLRRGAAFVLEVNARPNLTPAGGLSITKESAASYSELMARLVRYALLRE